MTPNTAPNTDAPEHGTDPSGGTADRTTGPQQTGGYGADEEPEDHARRRGGMNGGFQRSPGDQTGATGHGLDDEPGATGGTAPPPGAGDAGTEGRRP